MSKAFVNEDAPPEKVAVRAVPKLAPGEVRYITAEGLANLQAELASAQAALGREGPTGAGRADLEDRVRALTGTIAILTVVPAPTSTDQVVFGTWVELEDEDGERVRVRLVGPDEVDVKAGRISVDSPMARALLGREVGDEVTVQRPRGAKTYEVLSIS